MTNNKFQTKLHRNTKSEIHTRYFQPSSAWLGRSTGEIEEPSRRIGHFVNIILKLSIPTKFQTLF